MNTTCPKCGRDVPSDAISVSCIYYDCPLERSLPKTSEQNSLQSSSVVTNTANNSMPVKKGNAWWLLTVFIWWSVIASSGVGLLAWAIFLPLLLLQRYSVHREREKKHQEPNDYKTRLKQSLSIDWTYRAIKYNCFLVGGICIILIVFLISNPQSTGQRPNVQLSQSVKDIIKIEKINKIPYYDRSTSEHVALAEAQYREEQRNKSQYDKNMDFARELDRMETARRLDEMEKERRSIDRYREYR